MSDKMYKCAYKHCLHADSKVSALESVVINKKHYHWDCATLSQQIKECVTEYMSYKEEKNIYPIVTRIINTLVFKNQLPVEFILDNIKNSRLYYKNKPPQVLYGLRKLYWEYTVNK